jgi:hypothetical protein
MVNDSNKSLREQLETEIEVRQNLIAIWEREAELVQAQWRGSHFVYFMVDCETNKVKIGYTDNLFRRYTALYGMNSGTLRVVYYEVYKTEKRARVQEIGYHRPFAEYMDVSEFQYPDIRQRERSKREWFNIEGELAEFVARAAQVRVYTE